LTTAKNREVNKAINTGMFWLLTLKLFLKMVTIISTLILVRLLAPADFGLVALAMSFYAVIELMSAFGFEATIIQTKNASDEHYSTVWSLRLLVSLLLCLIVNLSSSQIALFYDDARLDSLIESISYLFIIKALSNPGLIKITKELDFKSEFKIQSITKMSSFVITMYAAYTLRNYNALIIGMYAGTIISVGLSYWISRFRPTFTLIHVKELFGFSQWMMINAWINFLNVKTNEIVMGYFGTPKLVGLLRVAQEIANMPSAEFGAAINRASYPGYAKTERNIPLLSAMFLTVLSKTSLVAIPTGLGIYLLSFEISHVLLGPGWESTQRVIELVALSSIFTALSTNQQYIYMALGKPKLTTFLGTFRFVLFFSMLIPLVTQRSLVGAAEAILCTSIIYLPVALFVTKRLLSFTFMDYFKVIKYHAISSLFMACALWFINANGQYVLANPVLLMLLKVFIGMGIFVATLFACWYFSGKPKNCAEGEIAYYLQDKYIKFRKTH